MTKSKLVKSQKITKEKKIGNEKIVVQIRHDDNCGNKHNTFSITSDLYERNGDRRRFDLVSCGCQHEEVIRFLPDLEKYIKWHLMSTDGPMHYLDNAKYWAGFYKQWCKVDLDSPPNEDHFKSTICYNAIPEKYPTWKLMHIARENPKHQKAFVDILSDRLPLLLNAFKSDVESLGLVY